jgi:hypothetical protein
MTAPYSWVGYCYCRVEGAQQAVESGVPLFGLRLGVAHLLQQLVTGADGLVALGGEAINANYRINLDVIGSVSLCQEYFY